jgi:hypothetical protein
LNPNADLAAVGRCLKLIPISAATCDALSQNVEGNRLYLQQMRHNNSRSQPGGRLRHRPNAEASANGATTRVLRIDEWSCDMPTHIGKGLDSFWKRPIVKTVALSTDIH